MPVASSFSSSEAWASVEVRRAVDGVLRRYGVGIDADDLAQDALFKALKVQPPPTSLGGCVALARKIAREVAIDHIRRKVARRRYDEGPCAEPDEQPSE